MNLKWLKSHYEEAATGDVPTPSKRVKYQDRRTISSYTFLTVRTMTKSSKASSRKLSRCPAQRDLESYATHVLGIETKPGTATLRGCAVYYTHAH